MTNEIGEIVPKIVAYGKGPIPVPCIAVCGQHAELKRWRFNLKQEIKNTFSSLVLGCKHMFFSQHWFGDVDQQVINMSRNDLTAAFLQLY